MHRHHIPRVKMNIMRRLFIAGELNDWKLAGELQLARSTIWKYGKEFQRIKEHYPDKLSDMNFYMPEPKIRQTPGTKRTALLAALPGLMKGKSPGVTAKSLYCQYQELHPVDLNYHSFVRIYNLWVADHPEWKKPFLLKEIKKGDLKALLGWRRSNDRRKWQIAVTLEMALVTSDVNDVMYKVESSYKSIFNWISQYELKGMAGLEIPKRITPPMVVTRQQSRKDNLFRLLQQTPKLHGLNRTSWSITCLTPVYNRVYQEDISYMQVSYCLQQMGYRYQRSREMLTSQDPKFREKVEFVQKTLRQLKPDEKFFSIDEFGPVGVKVKGGRTLRPRDEAPVSIPQHQRSNGVIICTAALELSTNQVTHFYSARKDTWEMIKLIDLLLMQYQDQKTLFLSWDAASWHTSKILINYIEDHNALKTGPLVKLAPLPSCTQYLNVIESVFGGLATAVIRNSNYASMEECKAAIDLHFSDRNLYFLAHPKRAGKKLWGLEKVVPEFKDTHHCRDRNAMKGAR